MNSRGLKVKDYLTNKLWTNGPDFLYAKTTLIFDKNFDTELEKRKTTFLINLNIYTNLFKDYSSYDKLSRIYGWVFKFINLRLLESRDKSIFFTTTEINLAKRYLIKKIQQNSYAKEIKTLQNKGALGLKEFTVNTDSKILKLSSFLDGNNILRVGGRIDKCFLPYAQKPNYIITIPFFRYYHRSLLLRN